MITDVGTRLYIAPEVQSQKGKARVQTKADQAKADMYSLGVSTTVIGLIPSRQLFPFIRLLSTFGKTGGFCRICFNTS